MVLAQEKPTAAQVEFFEKKIRPVLVQQCYKCHSAKSDKVKGELLLDTKAGTRMGGESGPAVVPRNLRKSLLIEAMRWGNDDLQMPPKKKLPDHVIADFEKWVAMGAPDPRDHQTERKVKSIDLAKGREFWAFRPVANHTVPKMRLVTEQVEGLVAIDRFIISRLAKEGIERVGLARPETLLRRLYFDLSGVPPTPE